MTVLRDHLAWPVITAYPNYFTRRQLNLRLSALGHTSLVKCHMLATSLPYSIRVITKPYSKDCSSSIPVAVESHMVVKMSAARLLCVARLQMRCRR